MQGKQIEYTYLRKQKANVLRSWYDTAFELKNNLEVWEGNNATILPLRKYPEDALLFGRAGVVDESGEYVQLSAIAQRVEFSYKFEAAKYKEKKVVYCGYLVNQWGHFLVESLSRLWYFLENDDSIDNYVFVVDEDNPCVIKGNYKEFFELLGIYEKLEIINKPTKYRHVIVPELGYKWRRHYSDKQKAVFDTVVKNVVIDNAWTSYEKIYMSRSQLNKIQKIEYGNDMLDDFFEKNGYKVISPEKISLSKLIFLMNNCKECATVSGSLPHNMLFAPDYSRLIIIERNVLNNEIQVDINRIKKLNVTYVDANIPIYSINLGYGPFIMAYNEQLKLFAEKNRYKTPDKKYISQSYLKKAFVMYMKAYQKEYRYQWEMAEWVIPYCGYLREGYSDGEKYFGDFLKGYKPFRWYHYFMPHYWKLSIKKFIGR